MCYVLELLLEKDAYKDTNSILTKEKLALSVRDVRVAFEEGIRRG